MENLVLHIVLPKGLRLKNGQTLTRDHTVSVISKLTPFFASIEQVKLAGGTYLSKLSDFTIACAIYQFSKQADAMSWNVPQEPSVKNESSVEYRQWKLWNLARQEWVINRTAQELVLNVYDLAGSRGSKTLGNFSINRVALVADEGMPKKITSLEQEANKWLITIKSGGQVGPGGHVKSTMAVKGKYDPDSAPPGRLWMVTGMGAPHKSAPGFGSSVGKPVRYSSSPLFIWRVGRQYGVYSVPISGVRA